MPFNQSVSVENIEFNGKMVLIINVNLPSGYYDKQMEIMLLQLVVLIAI